jgi:hypothetical protein
MKTKVVHSQSKPAWNVVGDQLGEKYKICRCPYILCGNEILDTREKAEALKHAEFISKMFNQNYEY